MMFIIWDNALKLREEKENVTNASHCLIQEIYGGYEPVTFITETCLTEVAEATNPLTSIKFLRFDESPARKK